MHTNENPPTNMGSKITKKDVCARGFGSLTPAKSMYLRNGGEGVGGGGGGALELRSSVHKRP